MKIKYQKVLESIIKRVSESSAEDHRYDIESEPTRSYVGDLVVKVQEAALDASIFELSPDELASLMCKHRSRHIRNIDR